MSNTFADFSEHYKPQVNGQLNALLKQTPGDKDSSHYELHRELATLIKRGGKRLRPLLCIVAYQAYGGKQLKSIVQVAASQELLHTFLLIHDDIIDRDYHRWGDRNILGVYFEKLSTHMTTQDALHAAEARALIAGDMCFTLANQALQNSSFNADAILRALKLQQAVVMQVLAGELADVAYSQQAALPTEAQILQMYADKTASYSFSLPLQIGALLADAPSQELSLLAEFAQQVGLAYQLQDDLLGMFGSQQQTGKPVISDLREGKRTLLVLKAMELAPAAAQKKLTKLLGRRDVTSEDLATAQAIITKSGAREYVEQLAAIHTQNAQKIIAQTSMSDAGKGYLRDLSTKLAQRDT